MKKIPDKSTINDFEYIADNIDTKEDCLNRPKFSNHPFITPYTMHNGAIMLQSFTTSQRINYIM